MKTKAGRSAGLAGALALATAAWASAGGTAAAGEGLFHRLRHGRGPAVDAAGTLGYGPPGVHPGFQGFGLGYHRGYGYGGDALGVGAGGGYPFYGGPGYIHPAPRLDRLRLTKVAPFPFYGGPGGPDPAHPQYYDGGPGPLVVDRPVISTGGPDGAGYGAFSGMMPYPDSAFAPHTARASGEVSMPGRPPRASAPALITPVPPAGEADAEADGTP